MFVVYYVFNHDKRGRIGGAGMLREFDIPSVTLRASECIMMVPPAIGEWDCD